MADGRLAAALAGRYGIERELGAGGMATVYLAHDLKHDRDVAIKVLHPDLGAALGSDRFLSEIRTTARLQHPHILPLLDSGEADGLLYYVMPLVTGETLRARLERERQLPVDAAVGIAREVADALGYAHGLGVVHRDIKPENILLQGGHALVADFGIALAVQQAGGQRMTQTGLSLGTPQYMSPEQAMGERSVDARSDVYALAAVTYEMLIGEPPFTGPTVQAIVARVMAEEPRRLVTQRRAIPEHVEYAVLRGLEKLPADRWPGAAGFAEALQATSRASGGGTVATWSGGARPRGGWRARLRDPVVLALGLVALACALLAGWMWRRGAPVAGAGAGEVVRFSIPVPPSGQTNSLGFSNLSISLDGRTLVYIGQAAGRRQQLMVRRLDEVDPRPLPGTEEASNPFFSPDGKWVGFVRGNQLFKVQVDGGSPQSLGTAPGTFNGASWSSTAGMVVSGNTALYLIPETSGAPRELGRKPEGEIYRDGPLVVDHLGIVLYASWSASSTASASMAIVSLATGEATVLDVRGIQPLGILDGALVYVTSTGVLMAVPVDVAKRRVTGTPVQLQSDVSFNNSTGLASAALSRDGTLFFQSGTQMSRVVLAGTDGSRRPLLEEPAEYAFPRLSPDATQLAITAGSADRRDIWLHELGAGTRARLTSEGTTNERPEWSPDGTRVLYRTDRAARTSIWWRAADGSAGAEPLLTGERLDVFEAVLSPDARHIVYQLDTLGADLFYRALSGDSVPRAVATNPIAVETMPRLSPDGRWVAFTTNESGRDEVVVQPFPGPGGRVQVSADGGSEAVWSRDGTRLFYRSDGQVMAARIRPGPGFAIAARDTLFADRYAFAPNPHANYDVMPDGQHFIFLEPASEGSMVVVSNWRAVLRERMAGSASR